MEESGNLLRGLSLAELKETPRVQAIQRDVQKKFEEKWLRANKQSLLCREGEDFLRIKKKTSGRPSVHQAGTAELEWMLSTVETLPIEERVRL